MCDIDGDFLGFTDIYKHLSKIIPKGRVILDLGCAYGTQAVYFQKHKKYIGVDVSKCPKVQTKNSEYHIMSIEKFIEMKLPKMNKNELFVIHSYVPNDNVLVRNTFTDLFVFYPKYTDHEPVDLSPTPL